MSGDCVEKLHLIRRRDRSDDNERQNPYLGTAVMRFAFRRRSKVLLERTDENVAVGQERSKPSAPPALGHRQLSDALGGLGKLPDIIMTLNQ